MVSKTKKLSNISKADLSDKPLLSIIVTTNLERQSIKKTLDSLPKESDIELVIVTLPEKEIMLNDLLRPLSVKPKIRIVFDRGLGIYEAMNLGIENCTGEFAIFINDDDLWVLSDFSEFRKMLLLNQKKVILCNFREIESKIERTAKKPLSKLSRGQMPTSHQAQIWPVSILVENGKFRTQIPVRIGGKTFNCRIKISSDFDFFVRVVDHQLFHTTDELITATSRNGFSNSNRSRMYFEISAVLFSNSKLSLVGSIILFLTFWLKRFMRLGKPE